jgi:hypothetical protein
MASKGFQELSDPGAAAFLVDYKFAVNRGNARVPVAYGGAYPGLVCGPFRCWNSWGYGPAYVGYEDVHFREGTIVFDLMQRDGHRVYRAVGEKPVRHDTFTLTQGDINGLVHHLLGDLKAGKYRFSSSSFFVKAKLLVRQAFVLASLFLATARRKKLRSRKQAEDDNAVGSADVNFAVGHHGCDVFVVGELVAVIGGLIGVVEFAG